MNRHLSQHEISQLKAKVDLKELVEQSGIALKRSGKSWVGHCPSCTGKKPKLTITPGKPFITCYRCGESWDAISWIREKDNVSFSYALEILKRH